MNKNDFTELKAMSKPHTNVKDILAALYAFKNNVNQNTVDWNMTKKDVLAKPLNFSDVDLYNLSTK